ncbi:translocation/assembly module TamB domain-containing protein [Chitinibacter sp. S2-10]|uniref:translocation/assembly module TamB domain-containing protein n=1 Tax=Chitinibacter sp. S2-10 TaxID=3373597 RepID=UPI0039776158
MAPIHSTDTPQADSSQADPAQAAQPALSKPRYGFVRRLLRAVFWSTLITFSVIATAIFALLSWFNSSDGRYWLVDAINHSGVATVHSIEGSFWSELTINQLKIKTESVSIALDRGVLEWEPYLILLRDVNLSRVSMGELAIQTIPAAIDQPPSPPPTSLSLPFGIHLDQLTIARLTINGAILSDIAGSISSNGRFHRLNLQQLRLPQGSLSAALNITGKAPFQSAGSFVFSGQLEAQAVRAFGKVEGPLRQLQIATQITNERLNGHVDLQADVFAPYAYQMVQHGELAIKGLNPALWHSAAPQAMLDISAKFIPVKNGVNGQLTLTNQSAGPFDQHKLPLHAILAEFALRDQQLDISRLQLDLPADAQSFGRIDAQGRITQGQLDLQIKAQHINPQQLYSLQTQGDMSGELALAGPWLAPGIKGEINDLQRKAKLALDIGWINPAKERRLAIRQAQLSRGKMQIDAKGEFNLLDKNDFALELELQNFNPAEFAAIPAGSISAKANLKGALQPVPLVDLQYDISRSQFNQQVLAGSGRVKLEANRLSQSDLWLTLGSNRLSAKGALGLANDQLQVGVQMSNLAQLGAGFQGRLDGEVTLSGELMQPKVSGQLDLAQLTTPFGLKAQQGNISLALDPKGALNLDARLEKLQLEQSQLDHANLTISGTMQQHELSAKTSGKWQQWPLSLELRARGGLSAQQRWQGQILSLAGQAGLPFKLGNSPNLTVSANSFDLAASQLQLGSDAAPSLIQLQKTHWQPGSFDSQGRIEKLSLAPWLTLFKVDNPTGDLQLAGDWNLKQTAVLNGEFNLHRLAGDVQIKEGSKTALALALQKLTLSGQIVMNKIAWQSELASAQLGSLSMMGDTLLIDGTMADHAPLNLALKGSLPKLAVFSPLLGSNVKLAGKLDLDIRRSGTVNQPQLAGFARIDGLAYSDANMGVKLQEGALELALDQQKISLKTFRARGAGKGELTGSGEISLNNRMANGYLQLNAKRFAAISKPDMLLVLSGQGRVNVKDNLAEVIGDFKADEGDIQFQSSDVPLLSADVRVVGREKPASEAPPLKLQMQLDFDLGKNFVFRGYGLDTHLEGRLRLKAMPNQALTATGAINAIEGEYKAYGQKLEIERGILSFQGAIDNPSLDILAIRRGQAVEAGVKVQGTAYSPKLTLYSEPNVPDAEKISWLLFGHGSDSMEKSDGALVLQLLNAMAGSGGGQSLSDEILGNLGIDEVGYKSRDESDGSKTQVVTVSKRLSKNLRVALEKSFNGLSDAVSFTLQLSRNWSVVSRVGVDDSALDVKYTIDFD